MELFRKCKNLIFYAGLEREEFSELLPAVREENRATLTLYSRLGAVMFAALFITSLITGGFTTVNNPIYLTSALVMLLILLLVKHAVPKQPSLVMPLIYVFQIVLYGFGVYVSLLHAEKPAVSAVAFLLVSPLLFYDKPIHSALLTAAVVAGFSMTVHVVKEPDVAATDLWNMVAFGLVAIFAGVFMMKIKIRALAQAKQIAHLSETDLLTGLKNRNHFENRLGEYPALCSEKLICVYGDVNGLHELNNTKGHPAGDQMLRTVAGAMMKRFGAEHTYRVGGDEFVAFRTDRPMEEVETAAEELRQELDEQGYHVSFGIASVEKPEAVTDVRSLVHEAEQGMYRAKQAFYRRPEHNRRNR